MENKSCFAIRGLSFAYEHKAVINDMNITIPAGKVVTLMGPNGCGKSTLFQLLTKNLRPDKGDILYGAQSISNMSLHSFARQVAIVHQNNTAPADMTVEQLVSYGRIPFMRLGRSTSPQKDTQLIERAMRITGISALRDCPICAISGGQRQRAWIAMALAQGTHTLLLDEPTTYLDIRYQLQILRLVQMLNRKLGISIIMVLHDINQAAAYSDEIIALSSAGRVVAQGSPKDVITTKNLQAIYGISLQTLEYEGQRIVLNFI